ncbi:hypothetical protein MTO96_019760 [Rhipicephalus appendiculatus]
MNNWDPMNYLHEEPSPQCLLRVKKDIVKFNAQSPARLFISPEENDITRVHVLMLGEPDSPYEGGFFQFFVKFPSNYPLSPPRVRFLTTDGGRVYFHTHLYPCGKVCVTTLGTSSGLCDWSPEQSLSSTLVSIQSLVGYSVFDWAKIQYETIRVAVCDQVDAALREDAMCPPAFRKIILELFMESYSEYEDVIKARLHPIWALEEPFTSDAYRTADYEALLTRLQSLKEKLELAERTFDYVSVLRGALSRGFASIPTSVTFKLLRADVSTECRLGLLRTLRGFLKLEPWALRLFDATGKYPTGLFQGSRADMGAFDECLETVAHDKNGNFLTRGQYCNLVAYSKNGTAIKGLAESLSDVLHPKFLYFKNYLDEEDFALVRLGICFIEQCGQDDLQVLVDSFKQPLVRLEVSNCVTAEPELWTTTQIAVMFFLGLLLLVVISATAADYIMKRRLKANDKRSTLLVFTFLHGVRLICLVHIVIVHFYMTLSDTWSRLLNMFIMTDGWTYMIETAAFNSSDTFFFLSGFFLCFTVTRQKKNGPVVFIITVVRRLIRVCVPLFFIIACFYPLPHFVTGPNAKGGFPDILRRSRQSLVSLGSPDQELLREQYLVDFQLFLVALPTLLILKDHKKALVAAFSVLSLLGCATGTWLVAHHQLQPIAVFPGPVVPLMKQTFSEYYIKPYYHAVCYFSGCMTFLLMEDFKKIKIAKGMQLLGWCVAVSFGLMSVFGFVSRLLSWNAFVPLSKLSFCVYIIHMPFIQLMLHASRERILLSRFNVVTLGFSVLVWNFLLSYLAFLACEAPITKLNTLIFGRIMGRQDGRQPKQPEMFILQDENREAEFRAKVVDTAAA